MPLFVGFLVEAEGLLAVGPVGHNHFGAAIIQPLPQLGTIVSLVAEKCPSCLGPSDQTLGNRTIMGFAAAQQDGKKTAFSICDCVDFRIAPAARAANRLLLFPLFAPDAERCALM